MHIPVLIDLYINFVFWELEGNGSIHATKIRKLLSASLYETMGQLWAKYSNIWISRNRWILLRTWENILVLPWKNVKLENSL